uniref:Uncharacterized protein n=1 Tax=viral metagenome TaxID=1070528 RepID=A0A6C0C6X5_9ZZZZ
MANYQLVSMSTSQNMGQPLPLPERIPLPDDEDMLEFKKMGIEIVPEDPPQQYVKYKLPIGWKTVDSSYRQDLPCFYIIDHENMKRISIHGAWKGTYDNELSLHVLSEIESYVSPANKKIGVSQTSDTKIMGNFMACIDPLKRPSSFQEQVDRHNDYETN